MRRLRPTLLPWAVALLGCASRDAVGIRPDAAGDGQVDTTVDDVAIDAKPIPDGAEAALTAYQGLFCRSYNACFPVQLASAYGDVPGCIARRVKGSLKALFGPGSNLTPDAINACAAGFVEPLACDAVLEFFGGNPVVPAACRKLGTLANGSSCSGSDQCQSASCRFDGTSRCGVCADRIGLGGTCKLDTDCVESARCGGTKCVAPVSKGTACDASNPCKVAYACTGTPGACTDRVAAGTACDPVAQNCALGQYCNSTSLKCEGYQTVKSGEACGAVSNGGLAFCEFGSKCKQGTDSLWKCVPAATEGAACSKGGATGSTCETPLQCVALSCVSIDSDACK
jgi:hypothetical protein